MKRLIEEFLYQVLADQLAQHLVDWINTAPWQIWFV